MVMSSLTATKKVLRPAKVKCVFYGALFLEKVTCVRKRFFYKKNGVILTFPLN